MVNVKYLLLFTFPYAQNSTKYSKFKYLPHVKQLQSKTYLIFYDYDYKVTKYLNHFLMQINLNHVRLEKSKIHKFLHTKKTKICKQP